MDYLYINAIVNETYLDLACGCAFPDSYKRRLPSHVPGDDFLNTRAVENVFSYFTIKENGKAPLLVLANVERQKNCASVGRATQILGWEWDGKLIEKNMDAIFGAKFYTEDEIDGMVAKQVKIPLPKTGPVSGLKEPLSIDFKTRKAILTAAFIRWLRHDDVLRIAVPAGVDYNSYVWQAMKQIYAFFPVGIRAEAGFCSYLPDVKKAGSRITFGFIPENIADSKTLFLDGSRRSALTAYENGTERRMIDQLIEFICGVDATTCADFLEELYVDMEGAGNGVKLASIAAKDYQPMGEAVGLLVAEEGPDKLMPRWKAFFAEQEKYSPSMRQRIGQKISSQIEPASFCQTYVAECRDAKSIGAVFEILKSYEAFCRVSPALAGAMWDATVKLLREKGASYKKVYDAVSGSRRELAAVCSEDSLEQLFALKLNEEWQPLKNQAIKTVADADKALKSTDDLYTTLLSSQRNKHTASLLKEVTEFRDLAETLKSDYAVTDVHAKFAKLSRQPGETIPQMKALMEEGRKLLAELKPHRNSDKKAALEAQINAFLAALKEKTGASDARMSHINSIIDQVDRGANYFAVLEKLDEAEKDNLDETCLQQMYAALWEKCPKARSAYDAAYTEKYGSAVTMDSLKDRPAFICKVVASDLSRINAVAVRYDLNASREKNLARMDRAKYAGKLISGNCAVEVVIGSKVHEGEWFSKLLKLEHDASSAANKKVLQDTFFKLVEAGVYTGEDLPACLKMISQCGLRFMEFFPLLIQGKISATPRQYREAYELILEYNSDREPTSQIRKMNEICEEVERDKIAYKAFLKFADECQGGKKKKLPKWLLPSAIGGGVLLVVLCVVLAVTLFGKDPEDEIQGTVPPVTQPVVTETPTEPPVIYVEPLMDVLAHDADSVELLYGEDAVIDFMTYHLAVENYLTAMDEATQLQVLDAYEAADEKLLGINDLSVSAEEYFFWLLWFNAKNANYQETVAFDAVLYEADALSVLRVIHHNLPETEVVEPENPLTQPENGTEAPGTEPASEPAASESTEAPTEAPTEPPVTMADLKEMITEAARAPYEQAKEANSQLILILKLFGVDFDKTFEEHLLLVNGLFTVSEQAQKELLTFYNAMPGNAKIAVAEGVEVTWDEYAFWKFWLIANGEFAGFNDTGINEKTEEILALVYELLEENPFDKGGISDIFADETGSDADDTANIDATGETLDPSAPDETTAPTEAEPLLVAQVESMGIAAQPAFDAALEAYQSAVANVAPAG